MIKMNDFAAEPDALRAAQLDACARVFRSGWWILGQEVKSFEQEWADWLQVPHAVGCGNGLDAIELGLRALGIGPGDEVITTPMTAFATVLAVLRAGATPVLADIDPDSAMLSVPSVRRCLSSRTRAIILVHLYGRIGPVEELSRFAADASVHLVEDCAQAHGASLSGRSAGSFGAFAAWSFYPTKNLGAIGDGGALTSADPTLAESVRSLRNYGQSVRYQHPRLGMNSRLDELQAAILRERLPHLRDWVERRRAVAHAYIRGITNPHVRVLPPPRDPESHAYHLFVVASEQRDALQAHLRARQIESLIHYPIPIHRQESTRTLRCDPEGLTVAEAHAATCLSVPCHPGLSDPQLDAVVAAINEFRG